MKKKVKVELGSLQIAVSNCFGFINTKPTIPIIENFKISFKDNGEYYIYATNLESDIIQRLKHDSKENFTVCVHALKFKNIITSLNGNDVTLIYDEEKRTLVVNQSKKRITFPVSDFGDYPRFEMAKDLESFKVPVGEIQDCLSNAQRVVNHEDLRPQLSGVSLMYNPKKENVMVFGCNSAEIMFNFTDVHSGGENQIDFILRKFFCTSFAKTHFKSTDVEISSTETRAYFYTDNIKIGTVLVNKDYFEQAVVFLNQTKEHYKAIIPYSDLFQAASRINSSFKDEKNFAKSIIAINPDLMSVLSINKEIGGKIVDCFGIKTKDDFSNIVMHLNNSYLMNATSVVKDDNLNFFFKDKDKIMAMAPVSDNLKVKVYYMFMPIQNLSISDEDVINEIEPIDEV